MRKFAMQRVAFLMVFFGFTACDQSQVASTPPQSPSQEPGPTLVEHGQNWPEYQQKLQELKSMQETIRSKYSQLSRQNPPAPGEPVFSDQAPTLRNEIIQTCDSLESGAQELLNHPYLREHSGESIDANDLISYARKTREKVQSGS